ncbi:MAG TPA: YbaK/EbsC family protein [Ktedonobacterales bacterium]|nr:YbaK/EbsC family protein [Ktedonobacterales bacterium]
MPCKEKLEEYLRQQQIPFQEQQHSIAYTAQDVAASEHISGKLVAKVVIVFADNKMVMLVLPASNRVDFNRLSKALGANEVRLADEAEVAAAFPDCETGAMPPFGSLYNLPMYVDERLAEDKDIVFPVGTHTETMRLKYTDYEQLVNPTLIEFARPPQAALP